MTSQLKSDTARANGAKSHGPKSAETRAISAANSLTHGLTAAHTTLLQCENAAEFDAAVAGHFAAYKPAGAAEEDLVNDMISARWRIRRLRIVETQLIDLEMLRNRAEVDKTYTHPDAAVHLTEAFRKLVEDARSLSLLSRYESRLHCIHDRAYRTLRELQTRDHPAEDRPETGAPVPSPEPAPPLPQSQKKSEETNPPAGPDRANLQLSILRQPRDSAPVPSSALIPLAFAWLAKRKRLHRL